MTYPDTIPINSQLWVVENISGGIDSLWLNKVYAWHYADDINKRLKERGLHPYLRVRSYPTQIGEAMLGKAYPEIE